MSGAVLTPRIVTDASPGDTYVRVDRFPPAGEHGLTIAVALTPTHPGESRTPQAALAHAQDAAGWSVGLGADGRATLSVGTARGPVSLAAGTPLAAGRRVEVLARIPGRPGGRLEIAVSAADDADPAATASVVLGAPMIGARAPLLWGCRELRDDARPLLLFDGEVAAPVIVADAAAQGARADLAAHPAVVAAWEITALVGRDGSL